MKRSDLLKAAASLPLIGALLSSPLTTAVATDVETAAEGDEWYAFGLSDEGMLIQSSRRSGWPSLDELRAAARNGLDRFEVWRNGAIYYQAPTIKGVLPRGWTTLEHAGHIGR